MIGKFISRKCEDSFTAAIFSHLLHLPQELWWGILRRAVYTENLPVYPGELKDVIPWPSWGAKGTKNSTTVRPDLFLRFSELDLIIEAKRWDRKMQSRDQWANQVIAYGNEYEGEAVSLRFLALGGLWNTKDEKISRTTGKLENGASRGAKETDTHCHVHKCHWQKLLDECKAAERELSRLRHKTSQSDANLRILENMIELFEWHGFQTGAWWSDRVENLVSCRLSSENSASLFGSNTTAFANL